MFFVLFLLRIKSRLESTALLLLTSTRPFGGISNSEKMYCKECGAWRRSRGAAALSVGDNFSAVVCIHSCDDVVVCMYVCNTLCCPGQGYEEGEGEREGDHPDPSEEEAEDRRRPTTVEASVEVSQGDGPFSRRHVTCCLGA